MRNRELSRQLDSLKYLVDRTSIATWDDIELQGHWGKYLCVLSAGFIENAMSEIYGAFMENAASRPVVNFASSFLNQIKNPKTARFVEVSRLFNQHWAEELEQFLTEDERRRNAIDSIMANRHLIAHGRNTSISVYRVREYLETSIKVLEFIESQCLS